MLALIINLPFGYKDYVTDQLNLSSSYPFEPPNIRFLTPIYHPNIDNSGRICHDALKLPPKVSPEFSPSTVMETISMNNRIK